MNRVGVLGATSLVGSCLLPMLKDAGRQVSAYSRKNILSVDVEWHCLSSTEPCDEYIPSWVSAAPIWTLPEHFDLLEAKGVRRIVALSSTSRFTKGDSADPEERETARRLAEAEERVQSWAENLGVEWVILRPTLIYGLGRDRNVSEIARFVRRFRFFPLLGTASGLRQPVHAQDVASACIAALETGALNRAYDISGGETLSYRDMVARIFEAHGMRPRFIPVPLLAFRLASMVRRAFSSSMAWRMNHDLVFDHTEAMRDLDFRPRNFVLKPCDLPSD